MSIKIWTAWRVPLVRLNEATAVIHEGMSQDFWEFWKKRLDGWASRRPGIDPVEVAVLCEGQHARAFNSHTFDFIEKYSRGFTFWIDSEFAYICHWGYLSSSAIPDWFEDFHYQDQTDRDESISDGEWEQRKIKWLELLSQPSYVHYVINPVDGVPVAFGEYTQRWVKERMQTQTENLEAAK